MSTVDKDSKRKVSVTPFVIEARTPRNNDLIVQCLNNLRLRGAVRASVEVFDKTWDEDEFEEEKETRPVGAKIISGVGELPGEQLYINPAELTWKTSDPMHGQDSKLERIAKAMKRALGMASVGQKLRGKKPREGRIDEDMMKSLCREILCFIVAEEARVVKGIQPTPEDVDDLPGRYLLNPANLNNWHQPRYEDEYEPWVRKLHDLSE
jgi:hypothetical protein